MSAVEPKAGVFVDRVILSGAWNFLRKFLTALLRVRISDALLSIKRLRNVLMVTTSSGAFRIL